MASRTNKLLLGCALGCGGILLLVVLVIVGFVSWLKRPGTLLEPARLLGAETTGYAEWTLSLDDPGTARTVEVFLDHPKFRQEIRTPFPPEVQKFLFAWGEERDKKKLRGLFPLVAAWTLRPGDAPDRDLHLLSASIKNIGNQLVFADLILGLTVGRGQDREKFQKIPHQDETLYRLSLGSGGGATFFIRGNDLFVAQDVDTARQAVDRLIAEQGARREATPLDALFARVPEDRPLRGAVSNGRGEIFRLWQRVAADLQGAEAVEALARQLQGATLEARFSGDGDLEGRVSLQAPGPEWAAAQASGAAEAFRAGLGYLDLKLGASGTADGEWIRIDFKVAEIPAVLDALLGRLQSLPQVRFGGRRDEGAAAPPPPQ